VFSRVIAERANKISHLQTRQKKGKNEAKKRVKVDNSNKHVQLFSVFLKK
jgi:hypothetical protein